MLNHDEAMRLLEMALRHSTAEQTEVTLSAHDAGLTRLANGGIHQNVAVVDCSARVRAVLGQRSGVAAANDLSEDGLRALVARAIDIARVSEPNPEFDSLPAPQPNVPLPEAEIAADAFTPEQRADAAAIIVDAGRKDGLTAAGHVSTARVAFAVGNSLGVRAFYRHTSGSALAIMTDGDASGYACWDGVSLDDAPVAEVAARAARVCASARDPQPLDAGSYTVILEPAAVAEMLVLLAIMGLGATAFQEERSFMSSKLGQQLVGENITLRDDAFAPGMIPMPFDFEGVPKQAVVFFERGVAKGVVYDSLTARKGNTANTGHALPAPNTYGPLPLHLTLDPGGQTRAEMIRGVARGVLVTRFHYVNIVHPLETIITGMTRDGTFLIENGAIARPVKNLRFTQSVLEALRNVSAIEREQQLVATDGLYCLVPALRR